MPAPTARLADLFYLSKLSFDTLHSPAQHKCHLLRLHLALVTYKLFRLAATICQTLSVAEVLRNCARLPLVMVIIDYIFGQYDILKL